MNNVIIFVPRLIFKDVDENEEVFILGVVSEDITLSTTYFAVHETCCYIEETVLNSHITIIGYSGKNIRYTNLDSLPTKLPNCVVFNGRSSEPEIVKVFSKGVSIPIDNCRVLIYDDNLFSKSELLVSPLEYFKNGKISRDYFKTVSSSINARDLPNKIVSNGAIYSKLSPLIPHCFLVLNIIICCSTKLNFLQKVSTLAVHFHDCFCNMKWALEYFSLKKRITLKLGNYVCGVMADWFCGILVIYFLVNYIALNELYDKLAIYSEETVKCLIDMVHYLMGSPADLKLNHPLNNVLGRFFLYHIDLWWSFLSALRPVLEISFCIFISSGFFGLSFQIAILTDMLAVASCHVYCIYVYAARLYNLQVTGLISLSRLFFGRKRNPLPGRVDSCPYTTEQLFIGTIAFTVLLFLLPTTLVYYIVFTTIRLILITIGGLLTQARHTLQVLPLYITWLWLFNPQVTTSSIKLKPVVSKSGQLLLHMSPQQSSWWQLTKACVPDPVRTPRPVEWRTLAKNLISGKLIYPL